jgi:hypothetical protein
MKTNLDTISKRFCNLACVAFVIRFFFPASPSWLVGVAMICAVVGLSFLLADEIVSRKQREQAAKPAIEPK